MLECVIYRGEGVRVWRGESEGRYIMSVHVCTHIYTHRAVLGEQFRGEGKGGEAMLVGQLLHEVFQHILVGWGEGDEVTRQRVEEEIQRVTSTIETLNQL